MDSDRCVCGCPVDQHHERLISVPLPPRSNDTVGFMWKANATYLRMSCSGCGCGDYLPDDHHSDIGWFI